MRATKKNYELAQKIEQLLEKEESTVEDAQEILSFVGRDITRNCTVQVGNEIEKIISRFDE